MLVKSDQACFTDDFNGGFMHVIHSFYMGVQKHLEHALLKHKQISFSQFLILVGFSCDDSDSMTQAKLADHLKLTEATVSRHITTLVTMKLLDKHKSSTNKKSYRLTLTKEGLQAFKNAKKIIMDELNATFSHISDKDREIITQNFITTTELLQQKK